MSDTAGFPLVGGAPAFPGKNNLVRDGSGSNAFGWENFAQGQCSFSAGYRSRALGLNSVAIGNAIASGNNSFASGINSTASNTLATALGNGCTASGNSSFAACFGSNASGLYAAAFNQQTAASANYSFAANSNTTASNTAASAFGSNTYAQGNSSLAIGIRSLVPGYGEFGHSSSRIASDGDCQHGWFTLQAQTTSTTPVRMSVDGATSYRAIAAGASWVVQVDIIARTTGAIAKSASFSRRFQIDRMTTAASTAIAGSVQTIGTDTGTNSGAVPAGWSIDISADTTNAAINVTVTGDTDTIYWAASVHYTQVIRA